LSVGFNHFVNGRKQKIYNAMVINKKLLQLHLVEWKYNDKNFLNISSGSNIKTICNDLANFDFHSSAVKMIKTWPVFNTSNTILEKC